MTCRELFERARQALVARGVQVTCRYGKPLRDRALDAAARQITIPFVPDLRRLYKDLGDGAMFLWEAGTENKKQGPYGYFELIPLDRLVEAHQHEQEHVAELIRDAADTAGRKTAWSMLRWLDFHEEGNGDSFAIDTSAPSAPVVFNQHDWHDGGDGTNGFLLGTSLDDLLQRWGALCFQRPRSLWWLDARKGHAVDWTSSQFDPEFRSD
jgi:hypothetical protein